MPVGESLHELQRGSFAEFVLVFRSAVGMAGGSDNEYARDAEHLIG
ncbi:MULTISPECIES: hypothetical protein [unclassified Glutamicibacter]